MIQKHTRDDVGQFLTLEALSNQKRSYIKKEDKYTYDDPQPYPLRSWWADLSRICLSFRAVSSPGRSETPSVRGSARSAPWRSREALTLRSTKESPKIPALYLVSVLGHGLSTGCMHWRVVLSGTSSPTSTHGEGHLPGRCRHRGGLRGWLYLGHRWNTPIAHATLAYS